MSFHLSKRLLALLLAPVLSFSLLVIIFALTNPEIARADGNELVENGDFEDELDGWNVSNTDVTIRPWEGHGLVAAFTPTVGTAISQPITTITETAIYRLSFNCRATNPTQPGWFSFNYTVASTDGRVAPFTRDTGSSCNSQWATFTADLLLLADATYTLTFSYGCCSTSPVGILDNISLVKQANVNDINTGIVTNGDFIGPSGWTYSGDAYHVMDWGVTNTQLGAVQFAPVLSAAISQQISDVPETAIYRLSFNCRGTNPTQPGWFRFDYTVASTDGRVAPFTRDTGTACNSQWATFTADLLLLADATYTLTFSYNCCDTSPGGILDNISLVKQADVDNVDTGIITNGDFIGPNGWTYSGTAYHVMHAGPITDQLGVTWLAPGASVKQTSLTVAETGDYRLSFTCRSAHDTKWVKIVYSLTTSSPPGYTSLPQHCNKGAEPWSAYAYTHTLTAGVVYTLTISNNCCGWTVYVDNVSLIDPDQPLPTVYPLLNRMITDAKPENCSLAAGQQATDYTGDPINTRNGNLSYQQLDLSIPVQGCNLAFHRFYASGAVGFYTTTMGYGWTHNYDMRLHFTNNEFANTIELQTSGGSRLPFFIGANGVYTAYPGVTAELSYNAGPGQYTVTNFNQVKYLFNSQGQLIEQQDPFGNVISFTYSNGRLSQAAQNGRYLEYHYNNDGRLDWVKDHSNRIVRLGYDSYGDLVVVTNTLELATTYQYSVTAQASHTHWLWQITDPSGRVVERTAYDSAGRAYKQWDGLDNLLVEIDFTISSLHAVTENGVAMLHVYDNLGTLRDASYTCTGPAGCQAGWGTNYNTNFQATGVEDANGHATSLEWDDGGSNLGQVTDALGNETNLEYDALNNLTRVVNAQGHATLYGYHNPSLPTFRTHVTDTLLNRTIYTPTASGLLSATLDPNNRLTTYRYNSFGQVTQTVQAAGTANAITMNYGYDAVGRLITTTQTSAVESHTTLNVYDNGDRLIATIDNWTGTNPVFWQNQCNTQGGPRDTDVCTRYGHDNAGRLISTTNTLSQTTLTFYDDAGRVVATVANWDRSSYTGYDDLCDFVSPDPEYNLCSLAAYDQFGRVVTTTDSLGRETVTQYNVLGQVSQTIVNYENGVFNAADPDADIITRYEYDAVGNTIIVTDTLDNMTRTFYDPLNRVEGTITNWTGPSITLDNCLSQPLRRDENICTRYQYDEVGNTIITTDTLGIASRTFYNQLNQVVATVQNWKPTLDDPADCILSPTNTAVQNICTLYGYDDAGHQITTTNALNQRTLTVYDTANRPVITVANWNGATIAGAGDCDFTPAQPYVNLCTITRYDLLGRRSQVQDSLGLTATFTYDGLGRVITTTRYLNGEPVATGTTYDALGNRLNQIDAEGNVTTFGYDTLNRLETTTSAEGVETTQEYDAASRVLETTDSLNHSTTYTYDDLDRTLTTTDAEDNTTTYVYDALGNQTLMIDAEGVRTAYDYDELNRLVALIENQSNTESNGSDITTRYTYDAIGNRIAIINALEYTSTLTTYDNLNRPVIVEDALGHRSYTAYNALGYRTVFTDANGDLTHYTYDGLNRTTIITYAADMQTVHYGYNALGNRTIMTDSLGTTRYFYDDLYRLITVTNPFTGTIGYGYDLVGNRTRLTYPDGKVVTYTYDMDNRLVEVEDWEEGLTTYTYDPAGRLITTTLPNAVVSVNTYDDANRLIELEHTHSLSDTLLARYQYQLDDVGNRVIATETLLTPGHVALELSPLITITAIVSNQQQSAVAYNSTDQEYLVAWKTNVTLTDTGDIYARRLDGNGTTIGSAFAVVTTTKVEQDPTAAYSPDAETFLVTWTGTPATSTHTAVYGRLLASDGQLATSAFILDSSSSNPRSTPDVIYDPAGNQYLVIWMRKTGTDQDLYASFVNASTGAAGTPFVVANQDTITTTLQEYVPDLATDGAGTFLAVWRRGASNQEIVGQRFNSSGLLGAVITITNNSADQNLPAVSFDTASQQYLVTWEDKRSGNWEIYGQFIEPDGDLVGENFKLSDPWRNGDVHDPDDAPLSDHYLVGFDYLNNAYLNLVHSEGAVVSATILSDLGSSVQQAVALASDAEDSALAVWESNHGTQGYDIYAKVITASLAATALQTTTITYTYDSLYRLTDANYTGALSATYDYAYDAVGNRLAYTATITATEVITYRYDPANQLLQSKVQGGALSIYQWDNAGRLITTTVGGGVSRVYQYSQNGNLITATVGSQVTTFAYDGNNNRLLMSVAGDTITYTLDYARGMRILLESGATISDTKHYLYGLQCIAELVAAEQPEDEEWRYYQRDGNQLVRQTTNAEAEVTLAWAYTPNGAVLMSTCGRNVPTLCSRLRQ